MLSTLPVARGNSFCDSCVSTYSSVVAQAAETLARWQTVTAIAKVADGNQCNFADGASASVVPVLASRLRPGDRITNLAPDVTGSLTDILVDRPSVPAMPQLLSAIVGYAAQPKEGMFDTFIRVDLPNSVGPKALILSASAVREYFYLLPDDDSRSESLYDLLHTTDAAHPSELRLAWRLRAIELGMNATSAFLRARVERAFNILAHPDLRSCYDRMRSDHDAPPVFPYGGFGSILVEGCLAEDGHAFFGSRIIAYKPDMATRTFSLLLRRCEFFPDRVVCRDPHRKIEVWLDPSLLPGLNWDLSWNSWRHWLKSRIEVDATLVSAGKYRFHKGEWILRKWSAALPSRLHVRLPETIGEDIERARALNTLLGRHCDLVRQVQAQIEKYPVEHMTVQRWFDALAVSHELKPHHTTWQPDYEPYYFEQLRRRSATWYLFRDEYLFLWRAVLVAEIPQTGHATYLFARPLDMGRFLSDYSKVSRDDIRRNRDDIATKLGFIGRVVRARRKKRWLTELLKKAGEKADYVEAFE